MATKKERNTNKVDNIFYKQQVSFLIEKITNIFESNKDIVGAFEHIDGARVIR